MDYASRVLQTAPAFELKPGKKTVESPFCSLSGDDYDDDDYNCIVITIFIIITIITNYFDYHYHYNDWPFGT